MRKKILYTYGQKLGTCSFIKDADDIIDASGQVRRTAYFLCECGNEFLCQIHSIKGGMTKSCGCRQANGGKGTRLTHGNSKNKLSGYSCWVGMIQRCTNVGSTSYHNYGAKGVVVCDRWMKYENFLEDMGLRPSLDHSIDRYPNKKGNYEPSNCRWATRAQQNNNKNNNVLVEYKGEVKNFNEWCIFFDINYSTSYRRYYIDELDMDTVIEKGIFNRNNPKVSTCPEAAPKGETHGMAKLTEENVLEILRNYKKGGESQKSIANRYGVSQAMIGYIVTGKSWKHL